MQKTLVAGTLLSVFAVAPFDCMAAQFAGVVENGNHTVSTATTGGKATAGACKVCTATVKSNAFHGASGTSLGGIANMKTKATVGEGLSGGTTDKGGGGAGGKDQTDMSGTGPGLVTASGTHTLGIGSTQARATGPGGHTVGTYSATGGGMAHSTGALAAATNGVWTGPVLGTLGTFSPFTAGK